MTSTAVRYGNFMEMICSFLKINCNKSILHAKFNPDMKEMNDWYDIVNDESLSIFLCYAAQDPKKYHLYVSVGEKTDGVPSLQSDKESVKGNNVLYDRDNFEKFFVDDEVKGLDSEDKEDGDGVNEENEYFSWNCEEVDDWHINQDNPFRSVWSTKNGLVPINYDNNPQEKGKNIDQ